MPDISAGRKRSRLFTHPYVWCWSDRRIGSGRSPWRHGGEQGRHSGRGWAQPRWCKTSEPFSAGDELDCSLDRRLSAEGTFFSRGSSRYYAVTGTQTSYHPPVVVCEQANFGNKPVNFSFLSLPSWEATVRRAVIKVTNRWRYTMSMITSLSKTGNVHGRRTNTRTSIPPLSLVFFSRFYSHPPSVLRHRVAGAWRGVHEHCETHLRTYRLPYVPCQLHIIPSPAPHSPLSVTSLAARRSGRG